MLGISPNFGLTRSQVLLKWANVGTISGIAVGVFYKAHSLFQWGYYARPEQRLWLTAICLGVAVCAFRELRIPPAEWKITEKKLRTRWFHLYSPGEILDFSKIGSFLCCTFEFEVSYYIETCREQKKMRKFLIWCHILLFWTNIYSIEAGRRIHFHSCTHIYACA